MTNAMYEFESREIREGKLTRLRDEFAMAALTGLTSAVDGEGTYTWNEPKDVADCAYGIADAMLAAREVKP